MDLISTQKTDGRANAVDCGAAGAVTFQIEAEPFLNPAAQPDNDMSWPPFRHEFYQRRVGKRTR